MENFLVKKSMEKTVNVSTNFKQNKTQQRFNSIVNSMNMNLFKLIIQ